MLATGSADTTVRVWDVGEEILPHADEWARVKRECFLGSSNERRPEQTVAQEKDIPQNQDFSSDAPDVAALENVLVLGQDDEDDGRNNRNYDSSSNSPATSNSGVAFAGRRESNQAASAAKTSAVAAMVAASKENARCALRSLRPEIIRQAGVRPAWRTGRVTAVLDRSACSLKHPAAAMGTTPGRGKKAKPDPLIEVQQWRGCSLAFDVGMRIYYCRIVHQLKNRVDLAVDCLVPIGMSWPNLHDCVQQLIG